METLNVILPVFALIAVGYIFRRFDLVSRSDFDGVETLSFKLLLPTMIIHSIYQSEITLHGSGSFVLALVVVIGCLGVVTLALKWLPKRMRPNPPSLTSLFQVVTRWNALIVLSFAGPVFGAEGLALLAIAMAFLIPFINVLNIVVLSVLLGRGLSPATVIKAILSNPLVIGAGVGLFINLAGVRLPEFAETALGYINQATLAVAILVIGAGFELKRLARPGPTILWAVGLKNILAPLGFLMLARWIGFGQAETVCGMLIVSAPAAANGYIVAKKMGGQADLYAYAMTWQLVASIVSVPIILAVT